MKYLLLPLLAIASASAVELDVDAVGRDLNGWQGKVARYSVAGSAFEVERPVMSWDDNGNMIVETTVKEVKRNSPVFEGGVRLLVSPDGLVRTASIKGTVDGRDFDTGQVTRPEPVVIDTPPADAAEGAEPAAPVEAKPSNPDQEMRDDLQSRLVSAIDQARASKKVVKRDLSAWIFTAPASEGDAIAEGTSVVLRSLFRHSK